MKVQKQMRFSSQRKLKEAKRVNSITKVEENRAKESIKETKGKEAGETELLGAVGKLQAEVSSLREEVAKQRIQQQPAVQKQQLSARAQFSAGERSARRDCQAYRAAGNGVFWQHCFHCGSLDHFQFQYLQRAKTQGNLVGQPQETGCDCLRIKKSCLSA